MRLGFLNNKKTSRKRVVLAILALAILLITLDFRNFAPLEWSKDTVRDGFRPIRNVVSVVFDPVGDAWQGAWNQDDLKKENAELRDELGNLKAQAPTEQIASIRLFQLLEENQLTNSANLDKVVATVLDQAGNFEGFSIEIDKGAEAGIQKGMPVVTSAGLPENLLGNVVGNLVGRVERVSANRAEVGLITDPSIQTGIRLLSSQEIFLAKGDRDGLEFFASLDTNIAIGDLAITSGIQTSIYPPDIIVGTISEIQENPASLTQTLKVLPSTDFSKLYFVTVLLFAP